MRSAARICWALCLGISLVLGLAITPSEAENIQDRHAQIIEDLLDGHLHGHSFLEAALVASGVVDRSEFARHRLRIDQCVALAETRLTPASSSLKRAEAALWAMHRDIVVGQFSDRCNNLAVTLSRGDYNCVTSTTVFQIVAQRLGLESHVELLPNHVRCRLVNETGRFTIETTSPDGVHAEDRVTVGRVITEAQLIGKLYYNRALELLAERSFEAALKHSELAWHLDPYHRSAKENVTIVATHWAINEAQLGHWRAAISLLRGVDADSVQEPLLAAAKFFVLSVGAEAGGQAPARAHEELRAQLLLAIAEHPGDVRLLSLLDGLPAK